MLTCLLLDLDLESSLITVFHMGTLFCFDAFLRVQIVLFKVSGNMKYTRYPLTPNKSISKYSLVPIKIEQHYQIPLFLSLVSLLLLIQSLLVLMHHLFLLTVCNHPPSCYLSPQLRKLPAILHDFSRFPVVHMPQTLVFDLVPEQLLVFPY